MNGNIITINKANIFKQKYLKNGPTLSLGKVGLNELVNDVKDVDLRNGVELKTRINFPVKLCKVKYSQSEDNYPIAIGRKDINVMRRGYNQQDIAKDEENRFND